MNMHRIVLDYVMLWRFLCMMWLWACYMVLHYVIISYYTLVWRVTRQVLYYILLLVFPHGGLTREKTRCVHACSSPKQTIRQVQQDLGQEHEDGWTWFSTLQYIYIYIHTFVIQLWHIKQQVQQDLGQEHEDGAELRHALLRRPGGGKHARTYHHVLFRAACYTWHYRMRIMMSLYCVLLC